MISVFGHLNPDTDAVTAALVYAHLLSRSGIPATAYRLGDLNLETAMCCVKRAWKLPQLLPALPAGSPVALVDHNESAQSLANLPELDVRYVVDHHKLGDLTTTQPAFLRFEPLGCTATLLLKLHREAGLSVEPTDARLLLSAVLSDTLHFRSPTTTDADRDAAAFLAPIAGIDDVSGLRHADVRGQERPGRHPCRAGCSRWITRCFPSARRPGASAWSRRPIRPTCSGGRASCSAPCRPRRRRPGLDGVLLGVVDILSETNRMLVPSEAEAGVVQAAFGVTRRKAAWPIWAHLISRKKQIVPALEAYFSGSVSAAL